MADDFEATLADVFTDEYGADEETATAAAANAAAFRDDYDDELTVERIREAFADADAYDEFGHRFDLVVGELAAATEDCTDSREYRLAGFDDMTADPEQGY